MSKKRRISGSGEKTQTPAIKPDVALYAAIFGATLLAYSPALRGGFLWDDNAHITRPVLQSLHGLWRIWFDLGATQQYYPLLHTAFWIEHRLWGEALLPYHLVSVLLHAVSACLVVRIVKRLALPGAWLAGFVFALHPVSVEAVAWISEQKSTLSGVFYLGAALVYLQFDWTRRRSHYALALALFVLALLSKTVTATLPAALLVVFWWQRGRLQWKRDLLPLLPWFTLALAAGTLTAWVERTLIGAHGVEYALTMAQRLLIAGRAIWFYAAKLIWPVNLMFTYPHWTVDPASWWQYLFPLGVLAAAAALWLVARRGYRGPLAGLLLFGGTLFPALGFLSVYPFRYSYVADHFQYLASLGVIVPVAAALAARSMRIPYLKAAVTVLVAACGVLSWSQSGMYRDAETLYRATLARNPGSWMAHNNLGQLLSQSPGRLAEAVAEYRAALAIKPDYAEAHFNLGNALAQSPGRLPDAVAEYQTALRINPDLADVHNNLGAALVQMPGRLPDAIAEYRAALRVKPDYADAHSNLGNALSQTPGKLAEAVAEYQAALRIRPDYAEAHFNLASALERLPGRSSEAVAEYEAAIRARPDFAEARNNLGSALAQIPGRLPDAIVEYEAALRIRPDFAEAHFNLGNALMQTPGRVQEAITHYNAALRIKPDLVGAQDMTKKLSALISQQRLSR